MLGTGSPGQVSSLAPLAKTSLGNGGLVYAYQTNFGSPMSTKA